MGSTCGDSVASQSQYSPPTVTVLTRLPSSETGFGFLPSLVRKTCTSQIVDVGEIIDPEDIPPAVLVQQEKLKKMKYQKKNCGTMQVVSKGERIGQIQNVVVVVVKGLGIHEGDGAESSRGQTICDGTRRSSA